MKFYSAIKKNELTQAPTWINLENIKLSERSQTQKATYCMIPLIGNVQNRNTHRNRKETRGCRRGVVLGRGKNGE